MSDTKTILLAAGGTGGHVFPAIATADELSKRGYKVFFATDSRGEKYLQGKGYDYKIISSASPTGKITKRFLALGKLTKGMVQSGSLIGKLGPAAVVGFGGYPSFPPLLAAKINFVKGILHEQNSVLGKANRFLAKYVNVVALSFPDTKNAGKDIVIGNPVRMEIKEKEFPEITDKLNILVTGGSQGAALFSKVLPIAFAKFANKIRVVQQVREEELEMVKLAYKMSGLESEVRPFFDDMPKQLAKSHLVIARSGASTIFELAKVGRPGLFIPLAISAENHQYYNAEAVCKIGGGWMIAEKDFNEQSLSAKLQELLANPAQLADAAEKIKNFSSDNAAAKLADLIENILR